MVSVKEVEKVLPRNFWPYPWELKAWLKSTLVHACHFEYYAQHFDLSEDLERPHDLNGEFSKLDPRVALSMALQHRGLALFDFYVRKGVELHRAQNHHKEDGKEWLQVKALDAICSRMEIERENYQAVVGNFADVRKLLHGSSDLGVWFLVTSYALEDIERPNLDVLRGNGLLHFPNIGLEEETYSQIQMLMRDAVGMYRERFGYTEL